MKSTWLLAVLGSLTFSICLSIADDDADKQTVDAKSDNRQAEQSEAAPTPEDILTKLLNANDWNARAAAAAELAAQGNRGFWILCHEAEKNESAAVRRTCFECLVSNFEKHPRIPETFAKYGLRDSETEIRYICAFNLGTHKVYEAHYRLRKLMDDKDTEDRVRLTAAKSLAELGEPDVIARLYRATSSDGYMDRYIANLGLKALSGKNLNDFEGYDYGEGAFVDGGIEILSAEPPEYFAEKKAKRYGAIAAYCKWLKGAHPELYKHLNYWVN